MLNARLECSALLLALVASIPLARDPITLSAAQASKNDDDSYVQITSVTIEPSTIHKQQKPDEATVTVQVLVHGKVPPDSTARIDVGTYYTKPPGNKVYYPKQSETVTLDKELIIVRFSVQTTSDTVSGKVVVAADIFRVTGVRRIKDPGSYDDWRGEMKTAVP